MIFFSPFSGILALRSWAKGHAKKKDKQGRSHAQNGTKDNARYMIVFTWKIEGFMPCDSRLASNPTISSYLLSPLISSYLLLSPLISFYLLLFPFISSYSLLSPKGIGY